MADSRPETVEQERSCSAASDLLFGHALNYAARGMSVFPLQPRGKTPLTAHGFKDATIDTEQLHKWWTRWPDANIGVATGRLSNLAVLDVDGAEGERSLRDLPGELPPTWTAITGRGAQLWYMFPNREIRNSAGKLGPRLDVRGTGGYVVAPPSVHPNGTVYQWIGAKRKRAAWPDWLLPAPVERPSLQPYVAPLTRQPGRYAAAAFERELHRLLGTPEGQRNEQLNRSVHAVARFDALSTSDITAAFTAVALRIGLGQTETELTIKSALEARGR